MKIYTIPTGPFATNCYIVASQESKTAAIIDPGVESIEEITHLLQKHELKPDKIILTHSHWDHIGDVGKLKQRFGIPVYIHELDKNNLELPGSDGLPLYLPIEGTTADHYLKEGETIKAGSTAWEVIHTPGHSPGGICLYSKKEETLFSGDTLFKGSIGNLSFPTSEPEKMWPSLEKLAALPPQTKVYPGHGGPTTIGQEGWLAEAKKIFS